VSSCRYRPSRPVAVLGAVLGAAFVVFGVVRMLDGGAARDGGGLVFLVLWCVAGIGIIGTNLWAAFSTERSHATFSRVPDDEDGRLR
jgi:hypothetical protein